VVISKPYRSWEFLLEQKQKVKEKIEEKTEKEKAFAVLQTLYFIWSVMGLLTTQWISFLIFVIYSLTIGRMKIISPVFIFLDAFLSFIMILWIILNGVHFKYDLWSIITNYYSL
jgi:hypothetical protein